jgi:predicted amidohydrolase
MLQICDPWGSVLGQCNDIGTDKASFCLANIDLESLNKVREQIPVDKQRRRDVYWR